MTRGGKRLLLVLCAAGTVLSFFYPNILLILADFILAMLLLKKGWLADAVAPKPDATGKENIN